MSNKKIFKKLYSEKINKDDNYKAVLKRIENNDRKSNVWKKKLVPVCSLMILLGLILINIKDESFKSTDEIKTTNSDYNIYINDNYNTIISFSSNDVYDIDYSKKVDIDYDKLMESSNYSFLIDLEIPDDLNDKQYKEVYVKENENNGYNLLKNYEFLYQHDNRKIMISFSDKYEVLKNESYEDDIKISKIDDTEVIIYQDGKLYIATFIYNDMSFTIKTNNIKKEELINLLISIIE